MDLRSFVDVGLDPLVAGAITLAALLSGLGFGIVPAWFASRAGHGKILREGERSSTPGRHRFQQALIVGEVALALLLLVAAGLMIQSFDNLRRRDLGFRDVAQRRREIGVRLALGAPRREVLGMVLRQSMTLVVAGAAAGVVASLALVRLLAGLLHDMSAYDPATLALAVACLLLVGLAASLLPARAAMKVDPVTAIAG